MRRLVSLLPATAAVCLSLTSFSGVPTANAASPVTGRLVDSTVASNPGVPNMTVRLRKVTEDGPGNVVDSAVTASDGSFSLDAGSAPDDEYYVQVVAGTFQGGWVGGEGASGPDWVQPSPGAAVTYAPGTAIGRIMALPAFVRGKVVNASSGNPVRGITVRMTEGNDLSTVHGSDVTNSNGVFRIGGLSGEDNFGLHVDGSAKDFETGWYNDFTHEVVGTWGAAAAAPLGKIGRVKLDKL
jgi:hypothetical protein